jgi:citrate synthase
MELKEQLEGIITRCHAVSAFRENPSSVAISISATSSCRFQSAVISAISMLGETHGPVMETVELLSSEDPTALAQAYIDAGKKVPGWGVSFVKGKIDPSWQEAYDFLQKNFTEITITIDSITKLLHNNQKMIYPNPACFTAATAIVNDIPADAASYYFIKSRLNSWLQIYLNARKEL